MVLPPWWEDGTWDIVPNTKDSWWDCSLWHEIFHSKGCSKTWVLHPHFEGNGFLLWLFQTKDFWKSKTKGITTKIVEHNNWNDKGCRCCENISMVGRNNCSNDQEDGSLRNQRHNLDDGINFLTKDWVNKHTQDNRDNHDTQGTKEEALGRDTHVLTGQEWQEGWNHEWCQESWEGFNRDIQGNIPKGIEAQVELAIENARRILRAAGSDLDKVLMCRCFLQKQEDFAGMNQVYFKYFGDAKVGPARYTVVAPPVADCYLFERAMFAVVE